MEQATTLLYRKTGKKSIDGNEIIFLYQRSMVFDRLFNPLRFQTDITLRDRRTTMLQKSLNERDIVTVVLVYLGSVPLSETVRADPVVTEEVANKLNLLLNSPFCYWEDQIGWLDAVTQAIVLDVLLDDQRNSKDPVLSSFLFDDIKVVSVAVPNDIGKMEAQDITDPESQIRLQHKSRRDSFIRAAAAKALLHR